MTLEHKTRKQIPRAGFVQSGKQKRASTSVLHYPNRRGISEDKGRFFSKADAAKDIPIKREENVFKQRVVKH